MKALRIIKGMIFSTLIILSFQVLAETNNISDATITKNIKAKFAADKTVSDLKVDITTNKGVVTLSGIVNTDKEASTLIELAESTTGVKSVEASQITPKVSKQVFADTVITAKVKGAFLREKLFGSHEIPVISVNVETTDGVVYLSGTAKTQKQADNAVNIAKTIKGVKNVESKITIK